MKADSIFRYRKTIRNYTSMPVSEQDLEKILDAAQTAPLALGDDKTTHITVVTSPELIEEIREACKRTLKSGKVKDSLYGASTMFLISATDISEDHIEYCNAACIVENILLQATSLGLGSTYIWGCLRRLKQHPEIIEKLQIPEGYEILSAAVVGHTEEPLTERSPEYHVSWNIIK